MVNARGKLKEVRERWRGANEWMELNEGGSCPPRFKLELSSRSFCTEKERRAKC